MLPAAPSRPLVNASVTAVAQELGLSRQVVSKILNGGDSSARASEKTRQRVLRVAQRLGYRPNAAAKAISTGRFNAIGLLMSQHHHQSTVFGDMLRGIHAALDTRGLHLNVTFVDDVRLTDQSKLPNILTQAMVDGLLLNYTHSIPARMVELIERHAVPAVWMNSRQAANCVYVDDEDGGYRATRRLIELGHRRILFSDITRLMETSSEIHYSHAAREAGYLRAMADERLEPRLLVPPGRFHGRDCIAALLEMLRSPGRPTAVVGYGAPDATMWMNALYAAGANPGPDLSLVCINHEPPTSAVPIDTMILPEHELGRKAADMLCDLIDGAADRTPAAVKMTYEAGKTCWPPPGTIVSVSS